MGIDPFVKIPWSSTYYLPKAPLLDTNPELGCLFTVLGTEIRFLQMISKQAVYH